MKECKKCLIFKELSCFPRSRNTKDGFHSYCRGCKSISAKKSYERNAVANRLRSIEWRNKNINRQIGFFLKRAYGITLNEYEELLKNQSGLCAVCRRDQKSFSKRLSVDHCHKTKKIRGLLCGSCNTAI